MADRDDNDAWNASGDDDEAGQVHGRRAAFTGAQVEEIRRLARRELTQGWREIGVNFGSYEGRQKIGDLLRWCEARKVKIEAGVNKVLTTVIGATVSAGIAAAAAWFSGQHK